MLSLLIFVIISLANYQTFNSKPPFHSPLHLDYQQGEKLIKYFSWIPCSPVNQHSAHSPGRGILDKLYCLFSSGEEEWDVNRGLEPNKSITTWIVLTYPLSKVFFSWSKVITLCLQMQNVPFLPVSQTTGRRRGASGRKKAVLEINIQTLMTTYEEAISA